MDIVDEEGNTLEDVVRAEKGLSEPKKGTELRLLEEAQNRHNFSERKKSVIFVVNSEYSTLESLPGSQNDIKLARKVFAARNYKIHEIKNSKNILEDVCSKVEEEGFKESASDVFQLVYCGHGIHKTAAEKGNRANENEKEADFNHVGEFGDCLVNVDGSLCSELSLALGIAQGLSENTRMCLFYDMCRAQGRVSIQTYNKLA